MANAMKTFRKVIQDYLDYLVLADGVVGVIISTAPVRIRIDTNIILTEAFLQLDKPLPPGAINQSVSLQRAVGGQKYYVIDKQYWR